MDHEHTLTEKGRKIGKPYKSYLLQENTRLHLFDGTVKEYPEGTWVLTSNLTDDAAIAEAKLGHYSGYSPTIVERRVADKYFEALKSGRACSCKNDLNSMGNSLIRDVPDPVVLSVSLTCCPCLHESKFCEIDTNGSVLQEENDKMTNKEKQEDKQVNEVNSLKSKILSAMGMSEEAEVESLKSDVSNLKKEIDGLSSKFDSALTTMQEELKNELKTALAEALAPVQAAKGDKEPAKEPKESKDSEVKAPKKAEEEPETLTVEVVSADEEAAPFTGEVVITGSDGFSVTIAITDGKGSFEWVTEDSEEESDEKSDEKPVNKESESKESKDKEPAASKGAKSKVAPIHDNIDACKCKNSENVYTALGRNLDGTRKLE